MKKQLLTVSALSLIFIIATAFIGRHNLGVAGYVASPGESSCSACHAANTAISGTSIIANPAFTGNQYVPGQTYTIQIGVGSLTLNNFGFGCEILTASNVNAGVMQNPQSGIQFSVAANGRNNATNTTKKAGAGFTSFQFEWVAPSSGNVNIYAAGNAVNANFFASGDAVSTASLSLTASSGTQVNENFIYFAAIRIYPNPVKSNFTFNYSLMGNGNVKVALFDLQGREITEFVSENQVNGLHTISASLPGDLNKGVYILKFFHNGLPSSQRLIITQ